MGHNFFYCLRNLFLFFYEATTIPLMSNPIQASGNKIHKIPKGLVGTSIPEILLSDVKPYQMWTQIKMFPDKKKNCKEIFNQ